ncbi:hypothetical protein COOONC_22849 [Cooperia oncophora]
MQYLVGNKQNHPLAQAIKDCSPTGVVLTLTLILSRKFQLASSGVTIALVVKFVRFEDRKLAVCRIFSGQISKGINLYVLGRKVCSGGSSSRSFARKVPIKARKEGSEAPSVTVDGVWALRGRDMLPMEKATAGVICAIDAQGLVQNSTLCSEAVSEGLDVGLKQGEPLVMSSVTQQNLESNGRV